MVKQSKFFYIIPAPLIVSNENLAAAMMKEKSVRDIVSMTELSDYTVVGIGAPDTSATIIKLIKYQSMI